MWTVCIMDNLLLFSEILLMAISLLLLIMNLYTYRLTKNKKVLIASAFFVIFFLQGLFAFLSEFVGVLDFFIEPRVHMFVDLLAVIVIYAAIVKK